MSDEDDRLRFALTDPLDVEFVLRPDDGPGQPDEADEATD